jgi:rfaE bifunctional protein nucleotidyltransferase chain/domain
MPDPTAHSRSKIKSIPELVCLTRKAKAEGNILVLANGCFDLLHVGHIRYLQGAKRLGDILLVAINSDASVRTLKGHGRPLQPEEERAEILAALECVDFVTIFDTGTVDLLWSELQPDIHAKGTDYTAESVPERQTVRSYGGRVAIAGDSKDHSTRDLIQSIVDKSKP